MTKEEKELLVKDLCARLPYGVQCYVGDNKPYTLRSISIDNIDGTLLEFYETKDGLNMQVYLSECKPFLIPLSNMTDEQKDEFDSLYTYDALIIEPQIKLINWCYENHFDINGLIPKGLANDATDKNIYYDNRRIIK